MSGWAAVLEWALTYAIHSTLLLGLVAVVTRSLVTSDAWRETLWRGALIGSVATATLAQALPFDPAAGRWSVAGIGAGVSGEAVDPAAAPERRDETGTLTHEAGRPSSAERRPAGPGAGASEGRPSGSGLGAALLVAWLAVAALLLLLLLVQNVRVFRRLRGREQVDGGRLVAIVAELRRLGGVWAPVRLSVSDACPTPVVIGGSEICLPPRFLDGLDEEQQRAALAHELAHVARRDPWWQLGGAVLHALLFFQPLNHVARRRLRESAENLCDDWAVRQTGSPLALGRCLADIASWVAADPLPHLGATPAMAEGGSPLFQRVRRIADGVAPAPVGRGRPLAATALLLCVALVVAPVVAGGSGSGRELTPPSGSLAERWAEAIESSEEETLWIGWGIDRPGEARGAMVISSTPGPAGRDGPPLAEALRDAGNAAAPDVAFLFGVDASGRDVDWMAIRSADAPTNLAGLRLVWLGESSHEESLEQLAWLFGRTPLAEVRAEIMAAYTLHAPGAAAHAAIAAGLAGQPDEEVRAEAADWLANQDTPADVALLERLAMEDPSSPIRQDAAAGLAEFTDPSALEALLRLARQAPDPRVRSEAIQQLEERQGGDVVAVLVEAAFEDPVAAVRYEAVDALRGAGTESARAALRRIASEHPDEVVRAEALQALAPEN